MKFATKKERSFPLHLDYVAAMPWKIKSPNLLCNKRLLMKLDAHGIVHNIY